MHTSKIIHAGIYKIWSTSKLQNVSSNSSNEFVEDPFFYQHRVIESVQTSGSGDSPTRGIPLLGRAGLLQ